MRLTNNLDLPAPIVRAIEAQMEDYDRGDSDFSITDLINPPQIVTLRRQFEDELVEDASQRIWMLMGSSIHNILEASLSSGSIGEVRLFAKLLGARISGKFDHLGLDDGQNILTDYKVTSAYAVKGEVKPEWIKQLNYYRWLLKENGTPVDKLQITAILRDWNQHNLRDPDYPRQSVVTLNVPVWDIKMCQACLEADIIDHQRAMAGNIRPCTDDERWCNPGKVALMKKGRKSAMKLFDTDESAYAYAADKSLSVSPDSMHYIEVRPTTYRRCEDYCAVSEFCNQWQEEKE